MNIINVISLLIYYTSRILFKIQNRNLHQVKKVVILNHINTCYGGNIALSSLCATLRQCGIDARILLVPSFGVKNEDSKDYFIRVIKNEIICFSQLIFYKITSTITKKVDSSHAFSNRPVTGERFRFSPFICDDTIVVYPDITYGNPLNAKHVVRWLLYYYSFTNDCLAYSKNDLFVAYRSQFNDEELNPDCNLVNVANFDNRLYRQYNFNSRRGKCYVIRKGRSRSDLPVDFDGPVIDQGMSDEEIVKIFNECQYSYSYDTQTFYNAISAVCGCIPIIVMEPGKTEDDYLSPTERTHYGQAYGDTPEQIDYAVRTRDLLLKNLPSMEKNISNVQPFLRLLNKRFGLKIER